MEASWISAGLTHPLALLALALAVSCSSYILLNPAPPALRRGQLVGGYAGVVVVALIIAAVSCYASPEEASRIWRVPPDAYWHALLDEFTTVAILILYFALMGTAVIGAPIIFWLARRGFGAVPWVLVATVAISVVPSAILAAASGTDLTRSLRLLAYLTGLHLLLATAFCLGAGLPLHPRRRRVAA